jgi:hypothetical protein
VYPPGFPLMLAPFAAIGHFPGNVQIGARFWAVVYLLTMAGAALALGGPWAGAIVTVLVWLSPFARTSARYVMSDASGALLAVLLLIVVERRGRKSAALAGLLAGAGVLVRLSGLIVLAALLLTLTGKRRWTAAVWALPPLLALGIYQWSADGAPWRSGYSLWYPTLKVLSAGFATQRSPIGDGRGLIPDRLDSSLAQWACNGCTKGTAVTILPHLIFYPLLILGLFWVFGPPLVGMVTLGLTVWDRGRPSARLALLTTAGLLVFYVFYYYQAGRFLAPAASMLMVTGVAAACRRLIPVRGRLAAGVNPLQPVQDLSAVSPGRVQLGELPGQGPVQDGAG